jgi:hypothetical protein
MASKAAKRKATAADKKKVTRKRKAPTEHESDDEDEGPHVNHQQSDTVGYPCQMKMGWLQVEPKGLLSQGNAQTEQKRATALKAILVTNPVRMKVMRTIFLQVVTRIN